MRLPKAWQPCSLWQFLPGSRACAEAARAWLEAIRAAPRWQQEMQQGRPAASSGLRALGILCSTRLQGAWLPAPELGAACCAPKLGALRGSCRGAHASCPLPAAPGGEREAGERHRAGRNRHCWTPGGTPVPAPAPAQHNRSAGPDGLQRGEQRFPGVLQPGLGSEGHRKGLELGQRGGERRSSSVLCCPVGSL